MWDLGLSAAATKTKSKAAWTFWIYTQPRKWGMRAAAQKFYALDAASFTSPVKLQGAWALRRRQALSNISGFQDFGWGVEEGDQRTSPSTMRTASSLPLHLSRSDGSAISPTRRSAVLQHHLSALNADAASGTGTTVDGTPVKEMAQAVINSSPYNLQGQYLVLVELLLLVQRDLQIYPVQPDPDIPAPSMWSVMKKYSVDGRISMWQNTGNHLDGIFLDNLTYPSPNQENHRRALWAYSDFPLHVLLQDAQGDAVRRASRSRSSASPCAAIWRARGWG